ncbi:recombinase family protein [Rhizobium sophoriradicis]|uniref:Recombinase family protein n=1 Tax=Rhizobium sophoriradicis TaxID=1535245 RepID=A0A2A5KKB8_9HYPH|nr:recombinase family protein [Rhizobium sophoriradicis]PCK77514.1 recombinase family protein [Rhizobium sophoriradicis]
MERVDEASSPRVRRAAGYFRVSTGRQAESDLSIPDQRNQALEYCRRKGWELVDEFIEPGQSATDDNRPALQEMIAQAINHGNPYDVIIVHSYSRFFRDNFAMEYYIRKLAKADVEVVSITQELGNDPAQIMMRHIIGLFDEYQSRETGKHTLRSMKENARQGFYNGAPLPLGYKAVEIEKRGHRVKKKVVVEPKEAETVRLIFQLYLRGDGTSGPLGLKALVSWLNERGYRTKTDSPFGVGSVAFILKNRSYTGEFIFNRQESKTRKLKPISEQVVVPVPPIISREEFEATQATLQVRNRQVTPPRIVTARTLLSGLVYCSQCGASMMLRTGTSHTGKVHRYYSCRANLRTGKSACDGISIRMETLDADVVRHLSDRLLTVERIAELVSSISADRNEKNASAGQRVAELTSDLRETEARLRRIYLAIEEGVAQADDLFRSRIAQLQADRQKAVDALARLRATTRIVEAVTPEAILRFSEVMRENIATGEPGFRRAYMRSVVERIVVGPRTIKIFGMKATLESALRADSLPYTSVRSFERNWRPLQESNLRQPA